MKNIKKLFSFLLGIHLATTISYASEKKIFLIYFILLTDVGNKSVSSQFITSVNKLNFFFYLFIYL